MHIVPDKTQHCSTPLIASRPCPTLFLRCRYSAKTGSRKDQENGASGRSAHSFDGLVGVLFSMIRQAYSPPVTLPGSLPSENDESSDRKSVKGQGRSRGQGLLAPGCDEGFGGGMLDLCLAEQCSSLLRVLYKVRHLLHLVVLGYNSECTSVCRDLTRYFEGHPHTLDRGCFSVDGQRYKVLVRHLTMGTASLLCVLALISARAVRGAIYFCHRLVRVAQKVLDASRDRMLLRISSTARAIAAMCF